MSDPAISFRLDAAARRALANLESRGMTRSEAIRHALMTAAREQQKLDAIRAEAAALQANEEDQQEMKRVAEFMESLRATG